MLLNKTFKLFLIMLTLLFTITLISYDEKTLRTTIEVDNVFNDTNHKIYLLDNNNNLVKYKIYIENKNIKKDIEKIINNLKINNENIPRNLNGYINDKCKIENIIIENNNLKLYLNEELLNSKIDKKIIITGLSYSLLELEQIDTIEIFINNKYIEGYNKKITKDIGINEEYLINNQKDINKVVINYLENINNETYLIPVTKYINSNKDKLEIIINELKNTDSNYISSIDNDLNVLNYKEQDNIMIINFNDKVLNSNNEINSENIRLISESIFDNYDVNFVMIEQEGDKIEQISRK